MKADHRLKVVIDTNVWISAALSQTGAPAQVVRHVLQHGVPVVSRQTFAELESRLWKPKFDRYLSIDLRRELLAPGRKMIESRRITSSHHSTS